MSANVMSFKPQRAHFCFTIGDDPKVWRMPALGSLPVKTARKLLSLADVDGSAAVDAAFDLMDELCPGLTDVVTMTEFSEIFTAWKATADINLGESSASSE